MKNVNVKKGNALGLLQSIGIYLVGVVLLLAWLSLVFGTNFFKMKEGSSYFWVFMAGYIVIGVALNLVVLRNLIEFHPIYNTIEHQSGAKISMILLWPIKYPMLYMKIFVTKHL